MRIGIPEYPTDTIVNYNDQNVPGVLLDTRTVKFTAPEYMRARARMSAYQQTRLASWPSSRAALNAS